MALRPRLLDWPASSTFKPHQVAATRRPRTEARVRRLGDARGIDKSRPVTEEPISKSSEEDNEAGELDKAEEVLSVVLPADEDATLPLYPGEEALDEPAPHVTA